MAKEEGAPDAERTETIEAIKMAQAGSDRKVAELQRELDELRAEKDTAAADRDALRGKYADIEKLAAQMEARAELLTYREEALSKALKNEIDPNLVLAMAGPDLDGSIRRLTAEVRRKVDAEVNQRLASTDQPHGAGDSHRPMVLDDLNNMTAAERNRIPKAVLDRLLQGGTV